MKFPRLKLLLTTFTESVEESIEKGLGKKIPVEMSGDMIERIQSASEKDFVKSGLEHSFERSAKVLRTDKTRRLPSTEFVFYVIDNVLFLLLSS